LQQIGIISFDTSAIADDAEITSATLTVHRQALSGNPSRLGPLLVDIESGHYGTESALTITDFEAPSSASAVGSLPYPSANKTPYSCSLGGSELSHINKAGLTQLKLRFATDDDNDTTNDYLTLYDGSNAAYRPKLDVT
jgi:hypothetical protein